MKVEKTHEIEYYDIGITYLEVYQDDEWDSCIDRFTELKDQYHTVTLTSLTTTSTVVLRSEKGDLVRD